MRIIGGRWKRTPLAVPDVEGLRPTPDRVRETLFNWLGQSLDGCACLDLFAGSGALGLEAASRGATQVTLVERDPRALDSIRRTLERLRSHADPAGTERVELVRADALEWLSGARRRYDLVFLDPPFGGGWIDRVLPRVAALLAPGGRIYVESDQALQSPPEGLGIARAAKAGVVYHHLLERIDGA